MSHSRDNLPGDIAGELKKSNASCEGMTDSAMGEASYANVKRGWYDASFTPLVESPFEHLLDDSKKGGFVGRAKGWER